MKDEKTLLAPPAPPPELKPLPVPQISLRHAWAARREYAHDLVARLNTLAGAPTGPQHVTWVGDLQQGDGGKGAMTDRLAAAHQLVCRVQGGDNAGHTSVFESTRGTDVVVYSHLLPSGLRRPGRVGILGNGVMVNPERLAAELRSLSRIVPDVHERLLVSERAHLVLPMHRLADEWEETNRARRGRAIGTTLRGIGPANLSKANRTGLRIADLRDSSVVAERIEQNAALFGLGPDIVRANIDWVEEYAEDLLGRAIDTAALVNAAIDAGYSVLLEGAQGPFIDPELGVYPYVTTSPTAIYSVGSGLGLDVAKIDTRVGVLKAYQTMVGGGPFVSEDEGRLGHQLRMLGVERGTTTGRDRRCGWLDLVNARWALEMNGYSQIVVTKLDVLDGFSRIGICTRYRRRGKDVFSFVPDHQYLSECEPVYEYFQGWEESTKDVESYADLPAAAREFLDYIEDYVGVEVAGVTKGPREHDLLLKPSSPLVRLYPPSSVFGHDGNNGRPERR